MDFRESLEFLYGLQTFGIKLGLDNTAALLDRAGHPERSFVAVHVAGTNGKGSVSAMLAEILHRAGYRVGLYTSPHLVSFTERIRIDGAPLDEGEVADLTAELRPLSADLPVTFFEFTTVLAMTAFARHRVEIAVVETGMGGRLDATNALAPHLTVITPVALDHREHLGATLAAIAAEKAGIVKPGVALAIGRQDAEALAVILAHAARAGAPTRAFGRDFHLERTPGGGRVTATDGASGPEFVPGLAGEHQFENAALAVQAVWLLRERGFAISDRAVVEGLAGVRWPGRLEWRLAGGLLLDGAHNPAGAAALADYLKTLGGRQILWIAGFKADKAWREMVALLLPHVAGVYAVEPPGVTAVAAATLAAEATAQGVPGRCCASPGEALQRALAARSGDGIVLAAGSLFLVGAVRAILEEGGAG